MFDWSSGQLRDRDAIVPVLRHLRDDRSCRQDSADNQYGCKQTNCALNPLAGKITGEHDKSPLLSSRVCGELDVETRSQAKGLQLPAWISTKRYWRAMSRVSPSENW
jgi:hypothetical protein